MSLRRTLFPAAFLIACLSFAQTVYADATGGARKAIQALYNKADAALAKKDIEKALSISTPDYEVVSKSGPPVKLQQMRGQLQQMTAFAQTIKVKTTIQKFKVKGNEATAQIKDHADLTATNPQNNQPVTIVVDAVSEDTWIKSGKSWLRKRSKVLSQKQSFNGKPVTVGKP